MMMSREQEQNAKSCFQEVNEMLSRYYGDLGTIMEHEETGNLFQQSIVESGLPSQEYAICEKLKEAVPTNADGLVEAQFNGKTYQGSLEIAGTKEEGFRLEFRAQTMTQLDQKVPATDTFPAFRFTNSENRVQVSFEMFKARMTPEHSLMDKLMAKTKEKAHGIADFFKRLKAEPEETLNNLTDGRLLEMAQRDAARAAQLQLDAALLKMSLELKADAFKEMMGHAKDSVVNGAKAAGHAVGQAAHSVGQSISDKAHSAAAVGHRAEDKVGASIRKLHDVMTMDVKDVGKAIGSKAEKLKPKAKDASEKARPFMRAAIALGDAAGTIIGFKDVFKSRGEDKAKAFVESYSDKPFTSEDVQQFCEALAKVTVEKAENHSEDGHVRTVVNFRIPESPREQNETINKAFRAVSTGIESSSFFKVELLDGIPQMDTLENGAGAKLNPQLVSDKFRLSSEATRSMADVIINQVSEYTAQRSAEHMQTFMKLVESCPEKLATASNPEIGTTQVATKMVQVDLSVGGKTRTAIEQSQKSLAAILEYTAENNGMTADEMIKGLNIEGISTEKQYCSSLKVHPVICVNYQFDEASQSNVVKNVYLQLKDGVSQQVVNLNTEMDVEALKTLADFEAVVSAAEQVQEARNEQLGLTQAETPQQGLNNEAQSMENASVAGQGQENNGPENPRRASNGPTMTVNNNTVPRASGGGRDDR